MLKIRVHANLHLIMIFAMRLGTLLSRFSKYSWRNLRKLIPKVQTQVILIFLNFIVELRKNLSSLISLAFTIISDESQLLKKGGFSLIIQIVKMYSQAIEKMRDEEEDDNDDTNQK